MLRNEFFFIALIFVLLGCGEDETPLFEMKFDTVLEIESGLNTIETFYFPINNIPTSFNSYANNLSADDIGSIRPASCRIEGGFSNINYNFIREIYINAIDPAFPNVSREIFYLEENFANDNNELELFGSLLNVKDVFINDRVNLEVRVRFRIPTPGVSEHRITFSLFAFAEE